MADQEIVSVELLMAQVKSSASLPDSAHTSVPVVSVSVMAKLSMAAVLPSTTAKAVVPAV